MTLSRGVPARSGPPIFRTDILANPGLSVPLGLAALAWLALGLLARSSGGLPLCIGGPNAFGWQLQSAWVAEVTCLDPMIAVRWALMVFAMMLPVAAPHFSVAVAKTRPRHQGVVLAAALISYVVVWLALGVPYLVLFVISAAIDGASPWPLGPVGVFGLAILWSLLPLRQSALRRCHRVPAFFGGGPAQAQSAANWGAGLAVDCAAVCWPAMAAVMLSGQGIMGMFVVTHVLLSERLAERPRKPFTTWPLALLACAAVVKSGLA